MRVQGEPLSTRMQDLYEIVCSVGEEGLDENNMQDKMWEGDEKGGAFFCNYEIFKHIYQVRSRRKTYRDSQQFLILIEMRNPVVGKEYGMRAPSLWDVLYKTLRW